MKLTTQKTQTANSEFLPLTSEKLFLRNKTIKNAKSPYFNINTINYSETVSKSINSGSTQNTSNVVGLATIDKTSSKRSELLRKLTEKQQNPQELEMLYSYSNKEVSSEEEAKAIHILKNHFLFQDFNENVLKMIVEDLEGFQVEAGSILYREGEEGNCFFIIRKGQMEVLVDDDRKKILNEDDCFGELALIHKCIRNATLRALTDVEIYVIEGEKYRDINQSMTNSKLRDILFYIDLIPWLKSLDTTRKNSLASLTILQSYEPGEKLISNNNKDNDEEKLLIVKSGSFTVCKKNKEIKKLYPREYFGEKFLFFDVTFQVDIIPNDIYAMEKSACYLIPKISLEEALGLGFKDVILNCTFRDMVSRNKFLNNLFMESHYDNLFRIFKLCYYQKGDVVFSNDMNFNKKVVLILEGSIEDVNSIK